MRLRKPRLPGGPVLRAKLKERISEFGEIPSLSSCSQVTFSDLGKAATFRDPVALSMVDEIARELSLALGNLICMVSPSLIILAEKYRISASIFWNG